MYCYKHKNTATSLSCGRCERPICTSCSRHTDVGVRCKECAPAMMRPNMAMTGGGLLGGAIVVILVIVVATSVLDLGSDDPYGDYWDDFPYEDFYGAVTVTEVADPWVPEDTEDAPPVGSRFVAIYVTVENSSSGDYPVHVSTYGFKIADREKFVYQAVDAGPRPALPTAVSIDKGERARGWVTFEVAEDSVIESITYFDTNISLPSVSAR